MSIGRSNHVYQSTIPLKYTVSKSEDTSDDFNPYDSLLALARSRGASKPCECGGCNFALERSASEVTLTAPVEEDDLKIKPSELVVEENGVKSTLIDILPSARTATATPTPTPSIVDASHRPAHTLNKFGGECVRATGGQQPRRFLSKRVNEEPKQSTTSRLTLRKKTRLKRTRASDCSAFFGMLGVCLAVIDAECRSKQGLDYSHPLSLCLRTAGLVTTVALLGFIFAFHHMELEIAQIDIGVECTFLVITQKRITQILLETFVCAITPLPAMGFISGESSAPSNSSTADEEGRSFIFGNLPIDTLLTVLMFMRCYLISRFIEQHSPQFRDYGTRMIAGINHVTVNSRFVLKSAILTSPVKVLGTFALGYWVAVSWMFFHCERDSPQLNNSYFTSVWFIAITFLTVGYGDVVPSTFCGRTISICTGVMGLALSSALISVVTRSLELSTPEKHVNAFMADSHLRRAKKEIAARVLQEMWLIYKYRCVEKSKEVFKVRIHQRRFLMALEELRLVKWEQRELAEQASELKDVVKIQEDMLDAVNEIREQQKQFAQSLQKITDLQLAAARTKVAELPSGTISQFPASPQSCSFDASVDVVETSTL